MKIVYLHQYFNTPLETGSTRSYEMALRMVRRGHEVHMITSDRTGTRSGTRWVVENVDGINVHKISIPYSNHMTFSERIKAFLAFAFMSAKRARSLKADIVYASSTPLTIAIPAIYATSFNRSEMILEVRDLWPEVPIALGALRNPLVKFAARLLEKVAYRRSRSIVVLSDGMKQGVMKRGISAGRIHVIPNAADVSAFRGREADGLEWRHSLPWLQNRPLVVHCGTMGIVNGVEFLADIAAETRLLDPEIQFLAIGDGNRKIEVSTRARKLGVLDLNFHLLPAVSKDRMPSVFNAATVTTCLVIDVPVLAHNSANKVFDSFAAGRPVAINYGGWQKELLESSGAGIAMHPTNAALAARQLVELIGDSERIEAARLASAELGSGPFDRDVLAKKLIDVLEN